MFTHTGDMPQRLYANEVVLNILQISVASNKGITIFTKIFKYKDGTKINLYKYITALRMQK